MSALKPVYIASSEPDAEIIRSLLKNAGIESSISADDGGGMLPNLAASRGVAVLVDDTKVEEALSVLDEFEKGETAISEEDGEQ